MRNHTIQFSRITEAKQQVDLTVATVADREAQIIIAERAYQESLHDDGVSAPTEIYEKREKARRELEVLKIEGNRAAAKLAEAEEQYASLVRAIAPQVSEQLLEIASNARQRLMTAAVEVLGEEVCSDAHFASALGKANEINEPIALARRINLSLEMDKGRMQKPGDPIASDLVSNIMEASRFF